MAASNAITKCHTCKEETTIYPCPGCSKYFCFDDLAAHRESLKPEFYEIEHQRNEFLQLLSDQQKSNANNHPLIKQINQWEQTSIDKIRQKANEERQLVQRSIQQCAQTIQIKLNTLTEEMQKIGKRQDFNEITSNKLRTQLEDLKTQLDRPIYIEKSNLKWKQHAKTIAGGNGRGNKSSQLDLPVGIYCDDQQQSIYIADYHNHRIVKWKLGENNGQIIAGGNGKGSRIDQLNQPIDVTIDQNTKSLIICDRGNRRIVRWSLENPDDKEIMITNIHCSRLMMNETGDLFVSDREKHEVKRWRKGEKEGILVAGGNGCGNKLNQFNRQTCVFVDRQEAVYVSDWGNNRVMKWIKSTKEGIVVAGGQGQGESLTQLNGPQGIFVNETGDVYVADFSNHRIVCWPAGSKEGHVIVGGNGEGNESNQLNCPMGLSFDSDNNLYVVDQWNSRVQRFEVDKN